MGIPSVDYNLFNYNNYSKTQGELLRAGTGLNESEHDLQLVGEKRENSLADSRCETCANRSYQDKSNDATVSFQSPTKINADQAAHMVAAHEQEHVRNEQQQAAQNDEEVVSQTVKIFQALCQECGRPYVAGGETSTVTKSKPNYSDVFNVGLEKGMAQSGNIFSASA